MTNLTHEQFIRCFGPANCWTGTVGEACCRIKSLLADLAALKEENDRLHEHLRQRELAEELRADDAAHRVGLGVLLGMED